jgi:hypothetical protein
MALPLGGYAPALVFLFDSGLVALKEGGTLTKSFSGGCFDSRSYETTTHYGQLPLRQQTHAGVNWWKLRHHRAATVLRSPGPRDPPGGR